MSYQTILDRANLELKKEMEQKKKEIKELETQLQYLHGRLAGLEMARDLVGDNCAEQAADPNATKLGNVT